MGVRQGQVPAFAHVALCLPRPRHSPRAVGCSRAVKHLLALVARVASSPFPQQAGCSGRGFTAGPACRAADVMPSSAGRFPEVPRGSHEWALQEGARRVSLHPR